MQFSWGMLFFNVCHFFPRRAYFSSESCTIISTRSTLYNLARPPRTSGSGSWILPASYFATNPWETFFVNPFLFRNRLAISAWVTPFSTLNSFKYFPKRISGNIVDLFLFICPHERLNLLIYYHKKALCQVLKSSFFKYI